uniref:InfA n=1 Tax=Oryza latifolia TaxID=4534 RepID=A0A2H4NA99_9ORYZ|nr:infA [Oryza latifolia]
MTEKKNRRKKYDRKEK